MQKKMEKLLDELVDKNSTLMLTFAFADMIYIAVMFLVYEMPIEGVIGLSVFAGGMISGIIMTKVTSVAGTEGRETLAGKLCYFPVDKPTIRKQQYGMAFKITGIQILLTMIPLVVMAFHFKLQNALVALFCTAFMMLMTGMLCIEVNLISYGRK